MINIESSTGSGRFAAGLSSAPLAEVGTPFGARNDRLAAAALRVARSFSSATRKAYLAWSKRLFAAQLNVIRDKTPPNSLKTAAGKTAAGVRNLRRNINADILGDISGSTSNYLSAVPNVHGDPVAFRGRSGNFPLVVSRVRSGKRPVRTVNALDYIERHSVWRRDKKSMHRQSSTREWAWTTTSSLRQAASVLRRRAGNLLSGWVPAARSMDSSSLRSFYPQGHGQRGDVNYTNDESQLTYIATLSNNEFYGRYTQQAMDYASNSQVSSAFARRMSDQLDKILERELRLITR